MNISSWPSRVGSFLKICPTRRLESWKKTRTNHSCLLPWVNFTVLWFVVVSFWPDCRRRVVCFLLFTDKAARELVSGYFVPFAAIFEMDHKVSVPSQNAFCKESVGRWKSSWNSILHCKLFSFNLWPWLISSQLIFLSKFLSFGFFSLFLYLIKYF